MNFKRTKPAGSLNTNNNQSIKGSIVGVFPLHVKLSDDDIKDIAKSKIVKDTTDGILPENILNLKFDPEAMIKPKTKQDIQLIVDELNSAMDDLTEMTNKALKRSTHETVYVNGHSFYQYMDENDYAHIEYFSKEKKEDVLSKNRRPQEGDIVEIFVIDKNYLRFKNKHGKIIGALHLEKTEPRFVWIFKSEVPGVDYNFTCSHDIPYDCEREVVKDMVLKNKLDSFINYGKPENSNVCS